VATGDWVWPLWNGGTGTTTSYYMTTTSNATWGIWNDPTLSTAVLPNNIWTTWNQTSTTAMPYVAAGEWVVPIPTPEQVAAGWATARAEAERLAVERAAERRAVWEAEAPERARIAAVKAREKKAANAKARRLLMSVLSPEQQDEYRRLERFHVIGSDGKKYRVHRGWHHNVELVEETAEGAYLTEQFCIAPRDTEIPEEDNLAAQKLMIEGSLVDFRRIANITRLHRRADDGGGLDVVRREAV